MKAVNYNLSQLEAWTLLPKSDKSFLQISGHIKKADLQAAVSLTMLDLLLKSHDKGPTLYITTTNGL